MVWHIGLHNHLSRVLVPAGPAGNLGQQLKGPFRTPKVRKAQRGIRRHHPHQCHIGKVVSLGDHLGPDQYLGLSAPKGGEDLLVGVPMGYRVSVHAGCFGSGEPLLYLLLHLLRADAEVFDEGLAAVGADLRQGLFRPAVVTAHRVLSLMIGHGYITVVARHHVSAGTTGDEGGVAPSIEEQHGLVPLLQAIPQLRKQQGGEDAVVAVQKLRPHIRNGDHGHGPSRNPVGELDQQIAAVQGPIVAEKGGGGAAQQQFPIVSLHPAAGDILRMVPGRDFALVAVFMLLVDDDEP